MKGICGLMALLLSIGISAADKDWLGEPAGADIETVALATIMQDPERWEDQPLMISGRVTDVCTNRGCWAVFEDQGEMLRIMAHDHGFVMPADLRGPALAHGVLRKVEISAEHARHLVEDDGADPAVLEQAHEYRLVAEGVRWLAD